MIECMFEVDESALVERIAEGHGSLGGGRDADRGQPGAIGRDTAGRLERTSRARRLRTDPGGRRSRIGLGRSH